MKSVPRRPEAQAAPRPDIPAYLIQHYDWAYVQPRAIRLFERDWLINLILWGHYRQLRDAALTALSHTLPHHPHPRCLQIACVYGDLSQRLLETLPKDGQLDVVDVLPQQLDNLRSKFAEPLPPNLHLHLANAAALDFDQNNFDSALLFFLLHEQPEAVRRATLSQALRVLKPGGHLVLVDYHRPRPWHPLYWPMKAILAKLEPFALDLWRHELMDFLPSDQARPKQIHAQDYFAGLYQLRVWQKVG